MIHFAIVENDAVMRNKLEQMLSAYKDRLKCLGCFCDAESFMQTAAMWDLHVVLMDIKLPGMSGVDCVQKMKLVRPEIQFLMLTLLEDVKHLFDSIYVGATGYLLKNIHPDRLCEAILDLHNGGSPISPGITRFMVNYFRDISTFNHNELRKLSVREREIINLLVLGLHYKEIAFKISISTETVRTHVRNIYSKLEVNSRSQAIEKIFRIEF